MKKIILTFVCLAAMSAGSFAASPNEDFDKADELYKSGNCKQAFELFKKAAERGFAEAQGALGYLYYTGDGVEQIPYATYKNCGSEDGL